MKKFFSLLLVLFITAISSYAADIKFVQVDSTRFSTLSEKSVSEFQDLIKDINKQKDLSFVIFTGDNIASSNKKFLTGFLKNANKLNAPYYIALGHKDLNKKKGLSKKAYMELVHKYSFRIPKEPNYSFNKKGVVFIVADGAKEFIPTPFGYYREDAIDWIDKEITKNSKKNVVIMQHFPVYPPAHEESYYTYKADEYMEMLGKHKNVKAVISGFKINSENDVNGIKHITTNEYPQYRVIEITDCTTENPIIWSILK